jgi:type IV pilus assembly protein PilC
MSRSVDRILLAVGLFATVVPMMLGIFVLPEFQKVFRDFGAELPLITSLVIEYRLLVALLPLLVIAAWLYWPNANIRGLAAIVVGVGGAGILAATMVVAMYLPIYGLAATI